MLIWPHFEVVGLLRLEIYDERGGMSYWPVNAGAAWHKVASRCGAKVADRAWAVFVALPDCQLPCSFGTLYFARVRGNWLLLWGG